MSPDSLTPSEFHALRDREIAARRREVASHPRLTLADARHYMWWEDSFNRIPWLIDNALKIKRRDWLTLLGDTWEHSDGLGVNRRLLRLYMPERGPVPEMMTIDEAMAWEALPERITVYRGCGPVNMLGASWSLSREVASRFPTLMRYRQAEPLLVTARVRRDRVLAVKLGRGELEVVTFHARRVAVERLPLNS